MKVLFLVNGAPESAAAVRAQSFAHRLPHTWQRKILYRPARKWKGILPFIQTALKFKPHLIYVMDTAYTGVLAGCIAKKLTGCGLITDTGDAAYELALSTGNYSVRGLALIRCIEQMALRQADAVVVRGSYHQELLEGRGVKRVVFVPDGVDLEAVKAVDASSLRDELGLKDYLVLGLVGSMIWSSAHHMCYGWDIVEAMGHLKDVPVKALLVGDGDGRAHLEARARELGVQERVIFAGQVPYTQLHRSVSAMDICVSTQSNDIVGMVRTTGKLPFYLALNRYVVASDVGEARRVLPEIGCLLPYEGVRDEAHPARLAAHVRETVADPALLQRANAGRAVAAQHFDYAMLAKRIEVLCEEVTARARLPRRSV